MYIILPTKVLAEKLLVALPLTDKFKNIKNTSLYSQIIKYELVDCISLVRAAIEEHIFNKLHWTVDKEYVLEVLVGTDTIDIENALSYEIAVDAIIDLVTPDLESLLENIVDLNLTKTRWATWHILDIHGDTVLEKGEDYRILEWGQKVSEGIIAAPLKYQAGEKWLDRKH